MVTTHTKPDKFEKMVEKEQDGNATGGYFFCPGQVVRLLRRQHNAVVRAVKKSRAGVDGETADFANGYRFACDDILATLARMKGGR